MILIFLHWESSRSYRDGSPVAGAIQARSSALTPREQVLLEGGADPDYGTPSALQCIVMFKQEDKWRTKFESAPGRGKATEVESTEERAPERMR